MTQIFVEGSIPRELRSHLREVGSLVEEDARITHPYRARGYIVSGEERNCSTFQRLAGLLPAELNDLAETNLDGVYAVRSRNNVIGYTLDGHPDMQKLLKEYAERYRINIRVFTPYHTCFTGKPCTLCDENPTQPRKLGEVNLYFRCMRRSALGHSMARLDGNRLDNSDIGRLVGANPLAPGQTSGHVIYDQQSGEAIAVVELNDIYLLVNLDADMSRESLTSTKAKTWKYATGTMAQILTQALPLAIQAAMDPMLLVYEVQRSLDGKNPLPSYLEATQSGVRREIKRREADLLVKQEQLQQLYETWLKASRELEQNREMLDALKKGDKGDEKAQQEYANVTAFPDYLGMTVDGSVITVYTKRITILHDRKEFDMGYYAIRINLMASTISFASVTNPSLSNIHPHISSSGSACWGNYAEPIQQALAKGRFEVLVLLSIQFLKSVNPSSVYADLERWPSSAVHTTEESGVI